MFIIGIPHFNNPIQKFISPDTKNDDMCKNILEDFQKSDEYSALNEIYFKENKPSEGSANIAAITATYCFLKINNLVEAEVFIK